MFKGFLSRRISYFLMIIFIILNSILIYFDIFYLLAIPLVILLGYLFVFRLDLIFLTIVFCTPLSFNFENLDLLGIGFYFPTEPLLLVFTLMFLFKALYEKNLKKDLSLALKAKSIFIQAPIPGMWLVWIEVPNEERKIVTITDNDEIEEFVKSVDGAVVRVDDEVTTGSERIALAYKRYFSEKQKR